MLYKRGKIYWCEFHIEGQRFRFSTKVTDKSLAKEIEQTIKSDIIRKQFKIPQKNKKKFILAEIFQEYIGSLNNAKGTVEKKLYHAKHFLDAFGNTDIKNITSIDIKSYQLKRKNEYLSIPVNRGKKESEINFDFVNGEILTLSSFFNYAIEKGYIENNPAYKIKKLNTLSRLKTLSDSDIEKLIAAATNKLTKDLITFLIYTGCRKGEALNLKWDDVDLQNDIIAIKGTKTKYDRYIPISKPLKELLSRIEKVQDVLYVFNRNGAKLSDFKRSFHTACRNAGLKDMHIHDLRHVFASTLTMNDVSLYKTGILLGHRTPNMTQRYAHLKPGELKKEIEKAFGRKSQEDLKRAEYERALEIIREYEKVKK